jgi:hypothetical protein
MPRRPSALCSDAMPSSLNNDKILIDQISCVVNQMIYKSWFHHPSGEWIKQPDHILTWIEHPQDLVNEIKCSPIYWSKFETNKNTNNEKKIQVILYVNNIKYIVDYDIKEVVQTVTEDYKTYCLKQEELSKK